MSLLFILEISLLVFNIIVNSNNKNKEGYVAENGWLQVKGTELLNSSGKPIQLRGISSHGIQWFTYTKSSLQNLKESWGINVFRIAMWTDPNHNGYIKYKELKNVAIELIDNAIELDMYVIMDWHILEDNNPNMYKKEAIEFFKEISEKYKNVPNVIYEICNEPNGDTTWEKDVKPYAEDVIKVIRKNSPKSLIIVGTPFWCKDLDSVLKSPLDFENITYAVHFYAGNDDQQLKNTMDRFLDKGLPIFVSECGMTDFTCDGPIYVDKFKEWIKFLDDRNISWIYWSISSKDESTSILEPYSSYIIWDEYGNFVDPKDKDINDYLSEAGREIKSIFERYKN